MPVKICYLPPEGWPEDAKRAVLRLALALELYARTASSTRVRPPDPGTWAGLTLGIRLREGVRIPFSPETHVPVAVPAEAREVILSARFGLLAPEDGSATVSVKARIPACGERSAYAYVEEGFAVGLPAFLGGLLAADAGLRGAAEEIRWDLDPRVGSGAPKAAGSGRSAPEEAARAFRRVFGPAVALAGPCLRMAEDPGEPPDERELAASLAPLLRRARRAELRKISIPLALLCLLDEDLAGLARRLLGRASEGARIVVGTMAAGGGTARMVIVPCLDPGLCRPDSLRRLLAGCAPAVERAAAQLARLAELHRRLAALWRAWPAVGRSRGGAG